MALLSQQQLEKLRANYSRIDRINPASGNYQMLISHLNKYPPEVLQQLATANIKFVSALARNRIKTKTEDASPSSVHSDIIEQLKSEIQQVSTVTDEQSYKRAVRQLLVRKPVIPAAQVEQFVRRFMQAYPYSQYRIAKKTGDMRTVESVTEADEVEDIEQDGDGEENPRDIEKEVPSELDLDWISKFDLGEIKEAIQKIIDHLSDTEDDEQIELLRNDIRILDNLHAALGKKDSAAVDKYWKIAQDSGSHEHLHPEFAKRMDDATALVSVKEGYVAENVTFKDKAKWDKAAKKYRVKSTGKSETAFCKETGAMMGRWAGEKGWLESC